jgi:pyridoxine 4-dehydrogenase
MMVRTCAAPVITILLVASQTALAFISNTRIHSSHHRNLLSVSTNKIAATSEDNTSTCDNNDNSNDNANANTNTNTNDQEQHAHVPVPVPVPVPEPNRRDFLKFATLATTIASSNALVSSTMVANAEESIITPTTAITATTTAAVATTASSSLKLPPMGLGAWAWGDSIFWGYNPKQDDDLQEVFEYAVSKDLAFFDTAEVYGFGRSETLLGKFRQKSGGSNSEKVQIATKFAALPFRTKSKEVVNACRASLKRLNPEGGSSSTPIPIDLYQIHFPNAWSNEEYWDGLAQCYEEGLVKSVGISNYGVDAMRAVHSKLAARGIPLATNQIQLSLIYKYPLENGLLDACNDLGVQVLSYSPLALGFLTGKYDKDTRPSGPRKNIAKTLFDGDAGDSFSDLITVMRKVADNHGGVPLSQVALNWTRAKGTIPIPGARNLRQVTQNIAALDWNLSDEEVGMLDLVSSKVPAYITPDKSPFPKEDINTKLQMFDS